MKRILLFIVLFSAGAFGQSNPWAQKFIQTMNDSSGVSIALKIEQRQFDSISTESGQIEILKKKHYILDLPTESVFVRGDTIQTWNKLTNQLIIDQTIPGEVNIFDLLTGDFDDVKFGQPSKRKNNVQMDFDLPQMGYGGELIIKKNGEPNSVRVVYGPDQSVLLTIKNFKKGNLNLYNGFNPKDAEVIDLRE